MARPGVTPEEIRAAINSVFARNENPTIKSVRVELGNTGSGSTIQPILKAWRDAAPAKERKSAELPEALQSALIQELERQAAAARSEISKELIEARSDADELAESGSLLENELEELKEENQRLSDESQGLKILSNERFTEIEKLNSELKKERENAENARIQVAQERNKLESQAEKISALELLNSEMKADLKNSEKARVDAEKAHAVAESKNDSLKNEVNKLDSLVKDLKSSAIADKNSYESKLEAVREEFNKNLSKRESEFENRLSELKNAHDERVKELKTQITVNDVLKKHEKTLENLSTK